MNDEALVLDLLCPDVPHLQNADRVASARIAVEELDSQLLILDDGFQHRRLARDLDIVLIDALNPWGYGHLLPRGLMRESISSLRRADVVLLTRADQCTPQAKRSIIDRIADVRQSEDCVEIAFPPRQLCDAEGKMAAVDSLKGLHVAAFCGIGNPSAFRQSLERIGVIIDDFKTFRDHHPYTRDDVEALRQWATGSQAAAILTTQKDLVKIGLTELADRPLWSVEIGVEILSNATLLESHFQKVLQKLSPHPEGGD